MSKFTGDEGPLGPPPNDGEPAGPKRPPKHTQFQPGESGNPAGRPKMIRPAAVVIDDVLNQKVVVTQGGRRKRMSAFEALILGTLRDALGGNPAARRDVMKFASQFGYSPPPIGFESMLQAWVGIKGELSDPAAGWLGDADAICELLRKAGVIDVDDNGRIHISDTSLERLMGPNPSGQKRDKIFREARRRLAS